MLLKQIKQVHEESPGTYGWVRVHAELTLELGWTVNRKRVARLMRQAGIQGLIPGVDAGAARCATRTPSPARTWSGGSSGSRGQIGDGSPISPNIPRWKARCMPPR